MALKGKIINISSTNAGGHTPIGINGRNRILDHNKDIPVSEAELGVLENSHVNFEVKGDAKAADLKGAVDYQGEDATATTGVPLQQVPGGDFLGHTEPDSNALVLEPTPVDQVPGGDNLSHGEQPSPDVEKAREDAAEKAQAAADGTAEPAVVLTNEDPDQTGLAVTPFDAAATLKRSIVKITEDMDEFTPAQIKQLLAAEKKGQARATLIAALERKA